MAIVHWVNVLGLDLSLTSTGYCHAGEAGFISTDLKGAERLRTIGREIENIAVEKKIQIAAIEGYSFASRNSQAHSIGELGGVVRVFLLNMEIPYIIIPPTCRAKFATGKGNAGKSEVISAISAMTGIIWKGANADDMCDAWVLEEMVMTKLNKGKYSWPEVSLSSLDKIDWTPLEGCENAQ
jgi:Holliday junction resolvasome RuvABC endonuclease subunit